MTVLHRECSDGGRLAKGFAVNGTTRSDAYTPDLVLSLEFNLAILLDRGLLYRLHLALQSSNLCRFGTIAINEKQCGPKYATAVLMSPGHMLANASPAASSA